MAVRTWSLATHTISFEGDGLLPLKIGNGSALDTFTLSQANDNVTFTMSADGSATANVNFMKNGTLTINLMQTTDYNNQLLWFYNHQIYKDNGALRVRPARVTVSDTQGNVTAVLDNAFLTKPADYDAGAEAAPRTWTVICGKISYDGEQAPVVM